MSTTLSTLQGTWARLAAALALACICLPAKGQLLVSNGNNTIFEYGFDGTLQGTLITSPYITTGFVVSGNNLFVAGGNSNVISEFTLEGVAVAYSLLGYTESSEYLDSPTALALLGSDLLVLNTS